MSDKSNPNRRDAMRMFLTVAAGAAFSGVATNRAMDNTAHFMAEREAKEVFDSEAHPSLSQQDIEDIILPIYQRDIGKMTAVATAFGGLIGSYHSDWDMDGFLEDLDLKL